MIDTNFDSVKAVVNFINNFISNGFHSDIELKIDNFYEKTVESAEKLYDYAKIFYDLTLNKKTYNEELIRSTENYLEILSEKLKTVYAEQKILRAKLKLNNKRNKRANNELYKICLQKIYMTILSYHFEINKRKKLLKEAKSSVGEFDGYYELAQKYLLNAKNVKAKCENELGQIVRATKNEIISCFEILNEKTKIANNLLNEFCMASNSATQCGFSFEGKILVQRDDIISQMNNIKSLGISLETENKKLNQFSEPYFSKQDIIFDKAVTVISHNLDGIELINSEFKDVYKALKKMKSIIASYDKIKF